MTFTLIAEIGGVHIGSLERAKELAKMAKISGADVLKTQKRNAKNSEERQKANYFRKTRPRKLYNSEAGPFLFRRNGIGTLMERSARSQLSAPVHPSCREGVIGRNQRDRLCPFILCRRQKNKNSGKLASAFTRFAKE